MRSIFRYPGGKTRQSVQGKILAFQPDGILEYREPFVGGGGIFFGINPSIKRWINDINSDLMSVYQSLVDDPDTFISRCRAIGPPLPGEPLVYPKPNSKGKKYNKRLKDKFDELVANREQYPALSYFFVNRTVWAGRVNYDLPSRLYFSNPAGWNIVETNRLEQAKEILKDVEVTCGSYNELLERPGDKVWIYCDPPYFRDTELSLMSKQYKYGFTKEDHILFAKAVKKCTHNVCVSYDDHPFIYDLFAEKGFLIHKTSWAYCGSSSSKKVQGKELVITNY